MSRGSGRFASGPVGLAIVGWLVVSAGSAFAGPAFAAAPAPFGSLPREQGLPAHRAGNRAVAVVDGPQLPAPALPAPPPVSAPVLDDAKILSSQEVAALDERLGQDNRSSVAQIAVATVDTTGAIPIATYAENLFDAWGVGDAASNDGVLVVVAATQHQVRIQTGSGLGSRLPDATAQQIIDDDMLPAFRADDDDQAVAGGVEAIRVDVGLPADPALAAGKGAPANSSGGGGAWTAVIWVGAAVVILGVVAAFVRRSGTGVGPDGGNYGGGYYGGGGMSGGGFGGGGSAGGGATGGW